MAFWDTFVKVWEVRTSIRIQEALEDAYLNYRRNVSDNSVSPSLISDIVRANHSWEIAMEKKRNQTKKRVAFAKCEYCSGEYEFLKVHDEKPSFAGFIVLNELVYRANSENIQLISNEISLNQVDRLMFYCAKKCLLSDSTVQIENIIN